MGNKVAMVNVADEYGIESANVSRKLFPAAGFDLVYDKSYPLGTQDYAPVIKAAKGGQPFCLSSRSLIHPTPLA